MLIRGGDSPVVTAAGAAEAAAANPAASVVTVPGAGHMAFWDAPADAPAVLRDAVVAVRSGDGGARPGPAEPDLPLR